MSGYKIRGASAAEARSRKHAYSRVGSTPQQLIAWVVGLFQDGKEAETDFENEGRHFINCALHGALQVAKFTAQDWKALRTDVASGFRQVALGGEWRLPPERLSGHEHIAAAGRAPHQGPPRALFLLACEHVLSLPDGQRLRVCCGHGCQRLFVRRKRQSFCSAKCLRNERDRRTRQNLTPEKLRARRHRYYLNRVEKLRGKTVAAHVRERPRRASDLVRKESTAQSQTIALALAIAKKRPALRKDLAAFLNECPNKRSLREHIDGRYEHCIGIYRTKKSAAGLGLECVQDALVNFAGTQSLFPWSPAQSFLLDKVRRICSRELGHKAQRHEQPRKKPRAARRRAKH